MQTLYTAVATSTGGRDGRAVSSDNILDVKLSTPKELGGAGGQATNPEQLFAAGYSACFIGALKFVASQTKRKIPDDASITAHVGIGQIPGGFGLDIDLHISLPGLAQDDAQSPGRRGSPGLPVLQRHPRQRRCAPARNRLTLLRHRRRT
jgi:Ohr subfamily peroxiredoxin